MSIAPMRIMRAFVASKPLHAANIAGARTSRSRPEDRHLILITLDRTIIRICSNTAVHPRIKSTAGFVGAML